MEKTLINVLLSAVVIAVIFFVTLFFIQELKSVPGEKLNVCCKFPVDSRAITQEECLIRKSMDKNDRNR